ncbi:MAG TPA: 16S rRNA (guanine(527)-N(7))-methyltransferase RsmG [Candidatus Limnocylindria bacterium]
MSSTDAHAAREALERLLEADASLDLPPGFGDAVERYVELLLDANRQLNLTRVVDPAAVARLHLLDALAALRWIDEWSPTSALDLGSGGGIPGIVLALARPGVSWTLVDSVGKKADAMRAFVADLGVGSVTTLAARAEDLGRDGAHREAYDLVAARALAPLPVLAEYALPLVRVGGRVLAWKGPIAAAELEAGGIAARHLGGGEPSVLESGFEALGNHRFVVITKGGPTPAGYPRRAGVPSRRPLA